MKRSRVEQSSSRFGTALVRRGDALAALLAMAVAAACGSPHPPAHHGMHAMTKPTAPEPVEEPIGATPVLDLGTTSNLDALIPALAEKRVVLIGETHDRLDHHLIQLEIIRGLHARHPELAIGMEFFQRPFQRALDDYVAGKLTERELLRETEYYERWSFDFRLYAPILRYALEHQLPLVALNLPAELTRKVGRQGIEALSDEERARIPAEIDRSDSEYRSRLEKIFEQHPGSGDRSFDRFLEVQLLWDEGMAERAAEYLESHPDHKMVILAGSGHIAFGSGIPRRLVRRMPVSTSIVVNGWEGELGPEIGDYLLFPKRRDLPAAGRIGALLEDEEEGLRIRSCTSGSPCETVGLRPGDRITSIDGQPIADLADLRVMMWDKSPGDGITLEVTRKRWLSAARQLTHEITLQ